VLSDWCMPRGDGATILRWCKASRPELLDKDSPTLLRLLALSHQSGRQAPPFSIPAAVHV